MFPVKLPIKSPWSCIFNDTIGAKILKGFLNKLRISREGKIAALTIKVSEIAFSVNKRICQAKEDSTIKNEALHNAAFICSLHENSDNHVLNIFYLTQPSSQDRKHCSAPSLTYLLGTIGVIFYCFQFHFVFHL